MLKKSLSIRVYMIPRELGNLSEIKCRTMTGSNASTCCCAVTEMKVTQDHFNLMWSVVLKLIDTDLY